MANGDPVAEAKAVLDAWPDHMTGRHTPVHLRAEYFARRAALASMIALNRSLLEPLGDEGQGLAGVCRAVAKELRRQSTQDYGEDADHLDMAAAYIERQATENGRLIAERSAARERIEAELALQIQHRNDVDREASRRHFEAKETAYRHALAILDTPAAPRADDVTEGEVCTGCGTTKTLAQIKAVNPQALSCCPERKMVPVRQIWREGYEARDQLDALTKGVAAVRAEIEVEIDKNPVGAGRMNSGLSYIGCWVTALQWGLSRLDQHLPPAAQPASEGE